jgi:RNA polymerase sigma factor (sigma-70 family)
LRTISLPASSARGPFGSKRLLALAGDERLVEQIRRGSGAAFEVAFERYGPGILGFCRHMLATREDAEDAVQHTFAAAYQDLQRGRERQIALKPWLYTIARNRCLSVLRARRPHAPEWLEVATEGLAEEVERRVELRELLGDLRELPEEQRAALLLAEVGHLPHADVARVLGCEVARVKALVFRARSGLIQRRDAREAPCEEIREQLANLHGGALRRTQLRHHLRVCPGCRGYRAQIARQRQMMAVALPVVPSLGLKSSLLASVGVGGGSAGGAAAAGAIGGATAAGASGLSAAAGAPLAKLAIVATLAGGGAVAGRATIAADDRVEPTRAPAAIAAPVTPGGAANQVENRDGASSERGGERPAAGLGGEGRRRARGHEAGAHPPWGGKPKSTPAGRLDSGGRQSRGHEERRQARPIPRGRGPVEAPPGGPPVRLRAGRSRPKTDETRKPKLASQPALERQSTSVPGIEEERPPR